MRNSTRYTDVNFAIIDISDVVAAAIDYIDMNVSDLSWNIEKILEMHVTYGDNGRMVNKLLDNRLVSNQDDAELIARYMIETVFPRITEMIQYTGNICGGISRIMMRRSRRNGVICHALLSVI